MESPIIFDPIRSEIVHIAGERSAHNEIDFLLQRLVNHHVPKVIT